MLDRTTHWVEQKLNEIATRLIQLADLVAYAMFRAFEHDDHTYFDVIRHRFDYEGGVEHGLYVQRTNAAS